MRSDSAREQRNKSHKTGRHASKCVRNKHKDVGGKVGQQHRRVCKVRFSPPPKTPARGNVSYTSSGFYNMCIEHQIFSRRRHTWELVRRLSAPFALNRFMMSPCEIFQERRKSRLAPKVVAFLGLSDDLNIGDFIESFVKAAGYPEPSEIIEAMAAKPNIPVTMFIERHRVCLSLLTVRPSIPLAALEVAKVADLLLVVAPIEDRGNTKAPGRSSSYSDDKFWTPCRADKLSCETEVSAQVESALTLLLCSRVTNDHLRNSWPEQVSMRETLNDAHGSNKCSFAAPEISHEYYESIAC